MQRGSLTAVSALVLALALAGCQSTGTGSTSGSGATGSEFQEDTLAGAGDTGMTATDLLQPVYFDYDKAEIRSDARPVLVSNAGAVKDNGHWGAVTIEGHCDERGSDEYNLALGERRANSVKRYLVDLGVASSRLRTVSFGESKPAVMGHDESAWRYNRRAEFAVNSR